MLQSIISPKLADEIVNYPSEYVAFCPDCLTVKNISTKLGLHDIMDIDSDTAKHQCGDCKTGIVSELLLPKEVTDEIVNVLINISDAEVPPSFYTEELLYPGRSGADFVVTLDNFLDDTFGESRGTATMELAIDSTSGLPMMIFECKAAGGQVESESGLLSVIGLVRLFKENPILYLKLSATSQRAVDLVGEFLLAYDIDARTRLLY